MTEKIVVAGLAIAFVLFVSNATAGPPGANVYVAPQTQQTTPNDQKNPDLSSQGIKGTPPAPMSQRVESRRPYQTHNADSQYSNGGRCVLAWPIV